MERPNHENDHTDQQFSQLVSPRPVLITEGRYKGYHKISRATVLRLRSELCGHKECTCGGAFGQRGGAYLELINEDYDRNYIIDLRGSQLEEAQS